MSWWKYTGRNIGRIIHFTYHYCGLHTAEHITIGADTIHLFGERFATYKWFEDTDVPVFIFLDKNKDLYKKNQKEKVIEAIKDSWGFPKAPYEPKEGVEFIGGLEIRKQFSNNYIDYDFWFDKINRSLISIDTKEPYTQNKISYFYLNKNSNDFNHIEHGRYERNLATPAELIILNRIRSLNIKYTHHNFFHG